jgi:nitronate monooxygenase
MLQNPLLQRLGIEHPVIQAPMGGGPSTPELVAAVSNAGGLGSLGAAYLTPDQITEAIRQIKSLTDKPFNVNLFAGGYEATPTDPKPMLAMLAEIHEALKLPAPVLPQLPPDPFPAHASRCARPSLPVIFLHYLRALIF